MPVIEQRPLCCAVLIFLAFAVIAAAEPGDYERALKAFDKGDYAIARIYFHSVLDDYGLRQHHEDALYYLVKISDREEDFVTFFANAGRFLNEYPYDMRGPDVFRGLLQKLISMQAYVLAVDYSRMYNYLTSDDSLFEVLGHGLLKYGEYDLADSILALCAQTDTVKIIRASLRHDYEERERVWKTLKERPVSLYLAENRLQMGDTVSAYLDFSAIDHGGLTTGALYRYAKLALYFDRKAVQDIAAELKKNKQYYNKALFLEALAGCGVNDAIPPDDEEEQSMCLKMHALAMTEKEPAQDLMLDSMLHGTGDTLAVMQDLRREYGSNYYIDSLYCQELLRAGRHDEARRVIYPYLKYCNAQAYVRKVTGIDQFAGGDYGSAAKNMILSNYHTPFTDYVLAECLRMTGHEVNDFYKKAVEQTADSALHHRALAGFVQDRYAAKDYQGVCSIRPEELRADIGLIKMYAQSLAMCGMIGAADSVHDAYFDEPDPILLNNYGLYLIDTERFTEAAAYFDSLHASMGDAYDEIFYNWALTSFLINDTETAGQRFRSYLDRHPKGSRIHDALFKIATLNYLQEDYDSAAYYYGKASEDRSLMSDALRNQLISYKKGGDWPGVISVGQKMIASDLDLERSDIIFDVGYAFLRAGMVKEAINNLSTASRMKSDPRFYYWLGEAYLAKGDFPRAFYSYRKVIDLHADDEMWVPTARYKTGIVLELMDEVDAAKTVYEKIVRDYGVADPIGAEADTRLKSLGP